MSNHDHTPLPLGYGIEPGELSQPVKLRKYEPLAPEVKKPDYSIYITLGNRQVAGLASQEPEGPEHLVLWDGERQNVFDLGPATKTRLEAISEYLQTLVPHAK